MTQSVDALSLLVPSYEQGLAFFRDALGFSVVEDEALGGDKRWVAVAPAGGRGAKIVLAVPSDERQRARVGDQTGGRVGYFLQTSDFDRDYRVLTGARRTFPGSAPSRGLWDRRRLFRPLGRQVGPHSADPRRRRA